MSLFYVIYSRCSYYMCCDQQRLKKKNPPLSHGWEVSTTSIQQGASTVTSQWLTIISASSTNNAIDTLTVYTSTVSLLGDKRYVMLLWALIEFSQLAAFLRTQLDQDISAARPGKFVVAAVTSDCFIRYMSVFSCLIAPVNSSTCGTATHNNQNKLRKQNDSSPAGIFMYEIYYELYIGRGA